MWTHGTAARIFIDGRTLHIKRLGGKFKHRTNVPYQYHYKKGVIPFLAKIEAYRNAILYDFSVSLKHKFKWTLMNKDARRGGGVSSPPPPQLVCRLKCAMKKISRFCTSEPVFFLQWHGLQHNLKQLLKHLEILGGVNLSKLKLTNQ